MTLTRTPVGRSIAVTLRRATNFSTVWVYEAGQSVPKTLKRGLSARRNGGRS